MRWLRWLLVIGLSLMSLPAAAAHQKPLSPEQAFQFSAEQVSSSTVILKWQIAPDYYLYRNRFDLTTLPVASLTANWPAPTVKADKTTHQEAGYTGSLVVPVVIKTTHTPVTLQVRYQGCSTLGFCYPPMKQTVKLSSVLPAVSGTLSLSKLTTDQNQVNQLLVSQHTSFLLLIFVGIGLLLSFTPCVLPMVPILTSIIIGQQRTVSTRKAFVLSVCYVLGTSITYAAAGVAAAWMGKSLQVFLQQPAVIGLGAMIFMLLGLSLLGLFDLRMPQIARQWVVYKSNQQKSGVYAGVFFMGVLSALLVSPCVTAPLVGVLLYIATTGDSWLGAGVLFAIGIGMGIPLVVVGVSAGKWLPKRGPWMVAIKKAFGLVMMGMGVWLLTRLATVSTALLLYGLLLLAGCYVIAVVLPRLIGWVWLNRTIGGLTGIVGILFIFIALNTPYWMGVIKPPSMHPISSQFVIVQNQQELEKVLQTAQRLQKPVLMDFYADWCESCIAMEKSVFMNPLVQQRLKHFILVRVDLTHNDAAEQKLMEKYKIIAPPTVVLMDHRGKEDEQARIVGEVNPVEFTTRISNFAFANCNEKSVC